MYKRPDIQCIGTNLWVDLFDFFELTEIMSQKDDLAFAQLLNRVREGKQTSEDLDTLNSRKLEGTGSDDVKHLPHLFCTKADIFTHNRDILSVIPASEKIDIEAVDAVSGNVSKCLVEAILSRLPLDPSKTMSLQKNLTLGIGLPVELCLNVDTDDGLTNGASCFVKKFDFRVENSSRCSIVWVEFDSACIGRKWRLKYKHLYNNTIPPSWTPILETCRKFTYQYHKPYLIIRRQFPLYLSSVKTIHKAQGSTIQAAVLHFGRRKIDHIHYVGLSRVTSLSGINIMELNSNKISVSPDVEAEMERLRTTRKVTDLMPDFSDYDTSVVKMIFQNCRSLRKHIFDIKKEHFLLQADVIGFAETRVSGPLSVICDIENFQVFSSTSDECSHGLAVYVREGIACDGFICFTQSGIECALISLGEHIVGFVYCPPRSSTISNFTSFLSTLFPVILREFSISDISTNLTLLGDSSYDYTVDNYLVELLHEKLGSLQLVHTMTTDYSSCLDHIYSNLPMNSLRDYGTLESYYSDHKPIYLVYQEKY